MEGSTLTIIVDVNGAGLLFTVKLAEIPSKGGETSNWTFGFPEIVPVTLIENEVVPPGDTVLELGVTKRLHAYTAGISLAMKRMEHRAKRVKTVPIRLKTSLP